MSSDPAVASAKPAAWPSLLVGIAASALMLLPSWVDGSRLPLQNLWQTQTMPGDMPFALLPLHQYYALNVFVMLLLGGVVAGLVARVLSRRRPVRVGMLSLGVLVVHLVVSVQAFAALAGGLGMFDGTAGGRQRLYFVGLLGGVVVGILFAQFGLWLTSRRAVAPVAVGIVLAAVPFATWIGAVITAFTTPVGAPMLIVEVLRWAPAVIVGVTLAWCGVRPAARLAVWVVGVLAVWLLPALFTAVQYGLGMRVLDGDVKEMALAGAQIFPVVAGITLPLAMVALGIAVAGVALRMLVRRHSS